MPYVFGVVGRPEMLLVAVLYLQTGYYCLIVPVFGKGREIRDVAGAVVYKAWHLAP